VPGRSKATTAKKPGPEQMPTTSEAKRVRHARIALPDDDWRRLKAASDRYRIGVAACTRVVVVERIERDEDKAR
jgi:hypothetical protein